MGRIWLNNKLVVTETTDFSTSIEEYIKQSGEIFDSSPEAVEDYINQGGALVKSLFNAKKSSESFIGKYLNVYLGTSNQAVNPTIASVEGEANTPAFRNRCYLVFHDLPLADYGNIIPKVEVEIINTSLEPTLQSVLEDVCSRSGLAPSEYDASALAGKTIKGAILKQDGQSVREFIEQLQRCYHFIAKEVKGIVKFEPIEQQTIRGVPAEALGTKEDTEDERELYTEIREQVIDLPSQVQIEYLNADNSYKRGLQTTYKAIASHINEVNIQTSVVLTDSEAKTAATKNLEYYWTQRRKFQGLRLPVEFLDLEPGQLIDLPIRNSIVTAQIEKINIGTNSIVEVDAVTYSTRVNNLVETVEREYQLNIIPFYGGQPSAIVLDINSIRDTDNDIGLYSTPKPDPTTSGWNGGVLFAEPEGGSYSNIGNLEISATQGVLTQVLKYSSHTVVDRVNKIVVELSEGQLESQPDFDFYNLTRLAIVNGELIGFQNAVLVAQDTYELSNLIRGARGTESFIFEHAIGSSFYLITEFTDIPGESSQLESNYSFKAVPSGFAATEIENETLLTIKGNRLKPYAPCNPYLIKIGDDLELNWYRRTRKQGQWLNSSEVVPLNEDIERYEIELYSGSILTATLTTTTPKLRLTVADQVSYFGSIKTSLNFKLYQISALVGRGYPLKVEGLSIRRVRFE